MTLRTALASFLAVLPVPAQAGGDYVQGTIDKFVADGDSYTLNFTQTEDRPLLFSGCKTLVVQEAYARVPWFSWFPLVHSAHPNRKQTVEAAEFLRSAYQEKRSTYFGWMGNGLVPTSSPCTFRSKGFAIEQDGSKTVVLSYHDQI